MSCPRLPLLLCLAISVVAQDAPVFKSNVNLVTFTATITDASGHLVRGLQKENIALFEDGVRQQVAMFHFEPEPVSVGIVFDTSGSMRPKIRDVAAAVSHFGSTAEPDDEIFLMRFSGHAHIVMDFTSDRERLTAAANDLQAGGATILYDAVSEALDHVAHGQHRKQALLVITDGEDTDSFTKLNHLLEQAKQSEVLVYCIGLGETATHGDARGGRPNISLGSILLGGMKRSRAPQPQDTVDMEVLNSLAEAGGARAWQVHNGELSKIDEAVQEISTELRQQYFIGYYPTNTAHDGSYRRIEVTTNVPEYKVRTRRGYYATK
jgi:Ca-activated chloride channel family protein